MTPCTENTNRRRFFQSAGGGLLLLRPETAFGSQANSSVEVGIVGCGGRGNWIGPFFPEFTGARIVALADVVKDYLETTRVKFKVDSGRTYYGPDACRQLASSRLDAVIIETPPYFHPEHAAAAVDAGKHVFLAKPVAVDVPGCRSILASGSNAERKGLSYWIDFQTRAQPVFQEAARRVHRGDIGKPAFTQSYYYGGRLGNRATPGMPEERVRLLNFYFDRTLGGDFIVEQSIHVIDLANWYLQSHPLRAFGTGGRTDWRGTQWDILDGWDHFLVTYWYADGVQVDFSSTQLTRSFSDLCVRCFGVKGGLDSHYGGLVRITGDNAWLGAEKDDTFRQGAINNVRTFIESIRANKPVNNAAQAVESTMTAILGRMAAYRQQVVSWDEMLRSDEKFEAKLQLRW